MNKISELKRIIGDNFKWNKARLDCFARMLLALFAVRTVNLSEIAVGFGSKAQVSSRYKRLHRFFKGFKLDYVNVAKWIFKLFPPTHKIYLIVDNPREQGIYGMKIEMYGEKIYLAGSRSERGELMIVATNECPKNAIVIYLRRWEIETLFSCLKGRGFRFEETHLTKLDRIEKLMALLAVGFCWAHKTGEWQAMKRPIVFKKHRDSLRPQNSFFRYGFDFIREIILSSYNKAVEFRQCLQTIAELQPSGARGL